MAALVASCQTCLKAVGLHKLEFDVQAQRYLGITRGHMVWNGFLCPSFLGIHIKCLMRLLSYWRLLNMEYWNLDLKRDCGCWWGVCNLLCGWREVHPDAYLQGHLPRLKPMTQTPPPISIPLAFSISVPFQPFLLALSISAFLFPSLNPSIGFRGAL